MKPNVPFIAKVLHQRQDGTLLLRVEGQHEAVLVPPNNLDLRDGDRVYLTPHSIEKLASLDDDDLLRVIALYCVILERPPIDDSDIEVEFKT